MSRAIARSRRGGREQAGRWGGVALRGEEAAPGINWMTMRNLSPDHHFVVADRGHLRIYRRVDQAPEAHKPRIKVAFSVDFPRGREPSHAQDTDQAGRFPGHDGRSGGMSIDERLPQQREQERKLPARAAEQINRYFQENPGVQWDFSAAPDFGPRVLDEVDPAVRDRLMLNLPKSLVGQSEAELLEHFTR